MQGAGECSAPSGLASVPLQPQPGTLQECEAGMGPTVGLPVVGQPGSQARRACWGLRAWMEWSVWAAFGAWALGQGEEQA